MLSFLRRSLRNPILLAILAVAFVAFIITGIGNPFGGPGTVGDGAAVAQVGDRTVNSGYLRENFDRRIEAIRQDNPQLTAEQAVREGGLRQVLEQIIGSVALEELARGMGLATSKRLVDADIAGMEAFRGPTGQFDEQTYRDTLQRQSIDERSFRRDLEGDVLRRHLLSVLVGMPDTPDSLAEPLALRQLEQRTLRVGVIPFNSFEIPAPSAEELEAFYSDNQAMFTIPEQRDFRYLLFDREEIAREMTVSDADVREVYEDSSDLYGATERRSLRQVVLQDRARAVEIATRAKNGEDLTAIAADELDYAAEDLALGEVSEEEFAGMINADVAEAAFAAANGGVVGPLESDFGYHVIVVDEVERSAARPLASVAAEIRQNLIAERSRAALSDLVADAQDAVDDGSSLTDVAADLGITLENPPPLIERGLSPTQPDFSLNARLTPIVGTVFSMEEGEDPLVSEIGDGIYAMVSLEQVIPPSVQPLGEIEDQVRLAYRLRTQIERAGQKAEEVVAAVKGGASLAAQLQSGGYPPPQELTARRVELASQDGPLPPFMTLGFSQGAGEIAAIPMPQQGVVAIVETNDIVPGRLEDAPGFLQSIKTQLRGLQSTEMQLAFANAVAAHVGTEMFPEAVTELENRYTATQGAQ